LRNLGTIPQIELYLSVLTIPLRFNDTSWAASALGAEKANKPPRKTLRGGWPYSQICRKSFDFKGFAASKVKALFLSKKECFYGKKIIY